MSVVPVCQDGWILVYCVCFDHLSNNITHKHRYSVIRLKIEFVLPQLMKVNVLVRVKSVNFHFCILVSYIMSVALGHRAVGKTCMDGAR